MHESHIADPRESRQRPNFKLDHQLRCLNRPTAACPITTALIQSTHTPRSDALAELPAIEARKTLGELFASIAGGLQFRLGIEQQRYLKAFFWTMRGCCHSHPQDQR